LNPLKGFGANDNYRRVDALSFMSVKRALFFRGFKVLVFCGAWARALISSFPEMLRSHIKLSSLAGSHGSI
jgi:hypothetical protein